MANVARRARTRTGTGLALAIAAVIGLSVFASACGGSSGAKVARVGTTTGAKPSDASNDPNAYSACMRSHGMVNFPDPGSDGRIHATWIDRRSPAFRAAYRACRALDKGGQLNQQTLTQLQRQLPQLLAFAKCMRTHGVPTFTDPEISPNGHSIAFGVVDANTPDFASAAAACRGKLSRDQSNRLFGKLLGGGKPPAPPGGK